MIGIYKITSPSGRVYIGQSTNIEKRFKQYKRLENCNQQPAIFNSFKKYGVENHIFEILEECEIKTLNNRERYFQDLYDSFHNGLNCRLTKTNDKSGVMSLESRKKMSESQKNLLANGYIHTSSKLVIDLETGIFYNSIKDCYLANKEHIGVNQRHFRRKVSGQRNNNTKFKLA